MFQFRHFLTSFQNILDRYFYVEEDCSHRHMLIHWTACLVELILVIAFVPLVFETNDDVVMNALVAGSTTSEPNEYMMFTNIVIGKFLVELYQWIPDTNWYTWYLVLSLGFGYAAIQYCFAVVKGSAVSRVVRHLLILGLFAQVFFVLQFTRVASVAIAGGILLIIMNTKHHWPRFAAGLVLIILGSAIRYPVFLMYAIIAFPVILGLVFRWRVRRLTWLAVSFAGCVALNYYHTDVYDSNPEMLEYKAFNSLRSAVTTTDSPQFTFATHGAFAEKLGWSENDFMLASNFNLDVGHPKFSDETLEKLIEHNAFELSDVPTSPVLWVVLKKVTTRWVEFLIQWQHFPLLMVFILLVLHKKRSAWMPISLFFAYIAAVSLALALFANGQLKPWVLYGMSLPAFLLTIYFASGIKHLTAVQFSGITIPSGGIVVLALFFMTLPFARLILVMPSAVHERIERDAKVHAAIREFEDPFYVGWTSTNHYDLFELPYDKSRAYALGWRAGSPWNSYLIEKYTGQSGIGVYNIVNQPVTWYFRTADDISFQNYRKLVEKFYKENYPESRVTYQKVVVTERDTLHRYTFLVDS